MPGPWPSAAACVLHDACLASAFAKDFIIDMTYRWDGMDSLSISETISPMGLFTQTFRWSEGRTSTERLG